MRGSTIHFSHDEWEKIDEKVKEKEYPSAYGYIKDLVLIDLVKDNRKDLIEYLCYKMGLRRDDLIKQAWKEYCKNHGLLLKDLRDFITERD